MLAVFRSVMDMCKGFALELVSYKEINNNIYFLILLFVKVGFLTVFKIKVMDFWVVTL
jgi:hypothetical protein